MLVFQAPHTNAVDERLTIRTEGWAVAAPFRARTMLRQHDAHTAFVRAGVRLPYRITEFFSGERKVCYSERNIHEITLNVSVRKEIAAQEST